MDVPGPYSFTTSPIWVENQSITARKMSVIHSLAYLDCNTLISDLEKTGG